MPETAKSLLRTINASGFLFQLRVEQEILGTKQQNRHTWDVVSKEHRWDDPVSNSERFVDLVLESNCLRMIVECKRVTDAHWVFLIPDDKQPTNRVRLFWTHLEKSRTQFYGWNGFRISPSSYESAFCTVRGKGERDTPMLERLTSVLLRSTEILAKQELGLKDYELGYTGGSTLKYIPVIVTNASLHACQFNRSDIDLSTGNLPDTHDRIEVVPYIRFRKSLSTTISLRDHIIE